MASEIRSLLSPPSVYESEKRVLHFLNTKFGTWQHLQDLGNLEELVEDARLRDGHLQSQLSDSQANVNTLITDTRTSAESHLRKAQELALLRHSVTDELSFLSEELVPSLSNGERKPTLLEELETLHRHLKELETVKGYMQIVERSLELSETAIQQTSTSPPDTTISVSSLGKYKNLQEFVSAVEETCSRVEDGSGPQKLTLVSFLESVRENTWTGIKCALAKPLLAAAETLQWSMRVDYASGNQKDRKAFECAFLNLLTVQSIGDKLHENSDYAASFSGDSGLYPLQILIQPLALRFKYHFEGSRQTNRLDKPEWYFTHVLNVANEHRTFMEVVIQKLIDSSAYKGLVAWREFVLLLLTLPSRKLLRTVSALLPHPSLLAHTIYQALQFDAALTDAGFTLAGTTASKKFKRPNLIAGTGKEVQDDDDDHWTGVSDVILGKNEWFDIWLEGERKFAEDQYHDTISSSDAWLIADDDGEHDTRTEQELRTTNSARRIKALIEQVTDRYAPLPSFTHRTLFLINVQLPVLASYHSRISSSLDAFETLSSAFVRAVPGAITVGGGNTDAGVRIGDTRRLTNGVEGVQRLVKALVSAKFLVRAMEGWGEEMFFLELWAEMNHRPSLRSRAKGHSHLPDPDPYLSETQAPEGTVFDKLIKQYQSLSERAEEMISQQVYEEIESGLRAHWVVVASPDSAAQEQDEISISPTILGPVALLSSHLTFLRSSLPQATLTGLYRRIASRLCTHILQRAVLYRGRRRITLLEGKIIHNECELWVDTCQVAVEGAGIGRVRVEAPWRRLIEAGRIMGADGQRWARIVDVTSGNKESTEWEDVMMDSVGYCELGRDEVMQIITMREDYEQ